MRLEVKQSGNVHRELVAAVGWNSKNELFSCGDDKQVVRWDAGGDAGRKVRRITTNPFNHTHRSAQRSRHRFRQRSRHDEAFAREHRVRFGHRDEGQQPKPRN